MTEERLRVTFLYGLGDRVHWDRATALAFTVVWRRWHQGEASTWVEYGLVREDDTRADQQIWQAYEADLRPAQEDTP